MTVSLKTVHRKLQYLSKLSKLVFLQSVHAVTLCLHRLYSTSSLTFTLDPLSCNQIKVLIMPLTIKACVADLLDQTTTEINPCPPTTISPSILDFFLKESSQTTRGIISLKVCVLPLRNLAHCLLH